jgi:hypothetical protein
MRLLISHTTINSFAKPNKPSRWCRAASTASSATGLFYLIENELLFVGRVPTVSWLQFQAETGGYKVEIIR